MGEEVETLADLLRSGLRGVVVGINPSPVSVAVGHYYQERVGQAFLRRLERAGVLSGGDGCLISSILLGVDSRIPTEFHSAGIEHELIELEAPAAA